MSASTTFNKDNKLSYKDNCEKKRIREWQRRNEVHLMAMTFDFGDYSSDHDIDSYLEFISDNSSITDFDETLQSGSLSLMVINDDQVGRLIVDFPKSKSESEQNLFTIATKSTCNMASGFLSRIISNNDSSKTQRRVKVSSAA